MRRAVQIGILLAALQASVQAGALTGIIEDPTGRPLPGADVQVQGETSGIRWRTRSDDSGRYLIEQLPTASYKITVRLAGFRTVSRGGTWVAASDRVAIDIGMELLAMHEVVTVTSNTGRLSVSPAPSLLLTRDAAGANLPTASADIRSLFDLAPGVIVTPAIASDAGQFTSNGQRPNTNNFRVDGVSANTGVGSSILPGAFPGASLPAMTAVGTTENLASQEAAQSVELRTAEFSSEFSGRPGANALVVTRSGSNASHREIFGRWRGGPWDAREWFSNSRGVQVAHPLFAKAGAALGGPLRRDLTFYFLSGEWMHLRDTGVELISVPSFAARQNAPQDLKPIFGAYPLPSGPNLDLAGTQAEGVRTSLQEARLANLAARLDHNLGRFGNLFARVASAPSRSASGRFRWTSATLGLTAGGGAAGVHEIRTAYSQARLMYGWAQSGSIYLSDVFTLAKILPASSDLDPSAAVAPLMALSIPELGQFVSPASGGARQQQAELRDVIAWTRGRHEVRAGGGYVRMLSARDGPAVSILGVSASLADLLQSRPIAVTAARLPQSAPAMHMASLFAQDTFRWRDGLSGSFGVTWDITPPAVTAGGIASISGMWSNGGWLSSRVGDVSGTAPWPLRWNQFSPRAALAFRPGASKIVFRLAGGAFRDAALSSAVSPINGGPFNSWLVASAGTSFTPPPATVRSAAMAADVQRFVNGQYPALRLPVTYQWRASVERAAGDRGLLSATYAGAVARNLVGHQAYVDPATNVLERMAALSLNSSNYHSLQLRYAGSPLRDLFGSVAFTWAHSIDDASQDSAVFLIHPGYRLQEARGSSAFDVRYALTVSLSYRLKGWSIGTVGRYRTGFPLDLLASGPALGQSFINTVRPDLVAGVPIWVEDGSAPGGWLLNPQAFRFPASGSNGTLGRNAIAGRAMAQLDGSVRRSIPLPRGLAGEIGINVLNVLNHPSFADPVRYRNSPWFGRSTSMQNLMLGTGTPNTGMPPMFQTGGPRSAEVTFKLWF